MSAWRVKAASAQLAGAARNALLLRNSPDEPCGTRALRTSLTRPSAGHRPPADHPFPPTAVTKMAPHHAFLFDAPVRYVLGGGALASAIWAFGFAAKDPEPVVHAEEFDAKGKKKVIVRTHSGQIPPGLTGAETEDGYHERLAKTNFGRSGGTGA